ncbi:radical SAM family heme chaperone HemW [Owenweeksia hongkongensis]|uniref:radical SAM family heme chaperone HemW n=1 Tax=Owenweeksia hongkongensis TaxID=253245 RepID=UPI003A956A53
MSGIYIHIPFCSKACVYCDFHFSTSLSKKKEVMDAICKEIELQKHYLEDKNINSIYFGGGTPSLMNSEEWEPVFEAIDKHFDISRDAEITLEANPDDLTKGKLKQLYSSPFNRLSIGVQSFDEEDLQFMNRSHNALQAKQCIEEAHHVGFDNLTIDLIYGMPGRSEEHWEKQLTQALEFDLPHISAYALTVEKETVLENWIKKGKVQPVDEVLAERNYYFLGKILERAGYEHYEVSNFAKPGMRAKHNSAYWQGVPYLGLGPSAHSFNGDSRQWNVSNNHLYVKAIQEDDVPMEKETLSVADRFNEMVMTSLRRCEGIDLNKVDHDFGADFTEHLFEEAKPMMKSGKLVHENRHLFIPDIHRFFSDGIASSLFYI